MYINAESIQEKEFHIVFKGYKPEEVDKFLDILTVEFDRLQKSQRELQENLERQKYEGDKESVEMKKVIQEALVSAHKVAEDIKQKAEKEAEELIRTKVAEQEESYKNLLSKKAQLERDIQELSQQYEDFKSKIEKLVDDLKETTSKLGEGKFINILGIDKKDFGINKINIGESIREDKKSIYYPEEELKVVEGTKEEEIEEEAGIEEVEEIEEEAEEEEEEEEKSIQEEEKKPEIYESEETKERDDEYKPKRVKKKIDIANPDIINDFFKTDED